jgi:hypothetical protein
MLSVMQEWRVLLPCMLLRHSTRHAQQVACLLLAAHLAAPTCHRVSCRLGSRQGRSASRCLAGLDSWCLVGNLVRQLG